MVITDDIDARATARDAVMVRNGRSIYAGEDRLLGRLGCCGQQRKSLDIAGLAPAAWTTSSPSSRCTAWRRACENLDGGEALTSSVAARHTGALGWPSTRNGAGHRRRPDTELVDGHFRSSRSTRAGDDLPRIWFFAVMSDMETPPAAIVGRQLLASRTSVWSIRPRLWKCSRTTDHAFARKRYAQQLHDDRLVWRRAVVRGFRLLFREIRVKPSTMREGIAQTIPWARGGEAVCDQDMRS